MRLISIRRLNGPNLYLSRPVIVARIELDELTCHETTDHPGFAARLSELLPGLAGHHCAAARPGGFLAALRRGTYFGHVTEHVTLELSHLACRTVNFGRTIWAGAEGAYDLIVECLRDEPAESQVPADLLTLAMRLVTDLLTRPASRLGQSASSLHRPASSLHRPGSSLGRPASTQALLTGEITRIQAMVENERLGVSTAALATAARRRGIPVTRIGGQSLLRLGHGCHRRFVWAAMTEQTSVVGADIASDKVLTKRLLAEAGVPVPDGTVVTSAAAAAAALAAIGAPIVVKPRRGNHGEHVSVLVSTAEEARLAYTRAAADGPEVIVESYITGHDYRVLIIDGQLAAAAELRPAHVTGDGRRDIAALVKRANADPRRGEGHARPLTRLALDEAAFQYLAEQGHRPCSVPRRGEIAWLRRNANLSTGGTSRDVTSQVHPEVADMCCRAAGAVGLDVCGVDIRLADIAAPLHDGLQRSGRAVIEINASPGLRMHLAPAEGTPRNVAGAVIDRLYPPGAARRIPIVSVTGTNGKTTTVRMIGHILRQAGLHVGMATTDGVYHDGRLVYEADASGPRSAEMVLADQAAEAAVLETARGGILRRGLGYDQADVAVVTNITADHLGCDGIDTLDDLADIKALVAEEICAGGSLVLNADDARVARLADRAAVRDRNPVVRFFTLRPADQGHHMLRRHRDAGGLGYELRDGMLVEVSGQDETIMLAAGQIPGAFGGLAAHVVANALAAAAACRALGVTIKDILRGLATFNPAKDNPGRGNVYRLRRTPVIVDYAHNPAAVAAMGRLVRDVWGPARAAGAVAAITLPGDRCDDLVAETAAAVADAFGHVVVYEDQDKRGREPGDMTALITDALERARPAIRYHVTDGPEAALTTALRLVPPGHPVLLLYEKLGPVRALLAELGAKPSWTVAAPAPADRLTTLA